MKSKGSKGWVMVRQKALRVIHAVGRRQMTGLGGDSWHHVACVRVLHLLHAVLMLLHAAGCSSQLLPDVEGEVVGGTIEEERKEVGDVPASALVPPRAAICLQN